MSITEELREFAWAECPSKHIERIIGIADRIDQQHEECAGFCRRLEDAASKGEEATLFGTDYVPLPKDADGETIHLGDELEEGKVARIVLTDSDWEPSVYVYKLPNVMHEYFCNEISHYHEPTVEDVLREFAERVCDSGHQWGLDAADTIAEYAAKLRLAGEDA